MQFLHLGLILCAAWRVQAYVGYDGKQRQYPVKRERRRLEHFLGLRRHHGGHADHAVVIKPAPTVHHGLHMLNHKVHHGVGPLIHHRDLTIKRFGKSNHSLRTRPLMHHAVWNQTLWALNVSVPSKDSTGKVAMTVDVKKGKKGEPNKGWDAIKMQRAQMCVDMLKEHGVDFTDNKDKCITFMDKTCKVPHGKGVNSIKRPSGEGVCRDWYDLLNNLNNAAPAGAPSPASYVAAAPGAAKAPSGMSGHDMYNPAWPPMDANAKLPEQGYTGEGVAHDNMKTATSDWHAEYGPHSGHQSYEAICAAYPDNTWCKLRGYRAKQLQKSAAARLQGLLLTLTAPLLVLAIA